MLDSDLAQLYGVETKHINQAVRNNPDKFPDDFYFEMTDDLPKEIKSLIYNNLDTTLFEKFGDGKEATEMLKKAIGFQDLSGKKKSKLIETWNTINPRERLMILKKITDGKKIY